MKSGDYEPPSLEKPLGTGCSKTDKEEIWARPPVKNRYAHCCNPSCCLIALLRIRSRVEKREHEANDLKYKPYELLTSNASDVAKRDKEKGSAMNSLNRAQQSLSGAQVQHLNNCCIGFGRLELLNPLVRGVYNKKPFVDYIVVKLDPAQVWQYPPTIKYNQQRRQLYFAVTGKKQIPDIEQTPDSVGWQSWFALASSDEGWQVLKYHFDLEQETQFEESVNSSETLASKTAPQVSATYPNIGAISSLQQTGCSETQPSDSMREGPPLQLFPQHDQQLQNKQENYRNEVMPGLEQYSTGQPVQSSRECTNLGHKRSTSR